MGKLNKVSFPNFGLDFELYEQLKLFGKYGVYWYGIIIGIGLTLAIIIAFYEFKKNGKKTDDLIDFLLFAVPLGIAGARLYYVIFRWEYYGSHLGDIIAIWKGGLAIYGGIITGTIIAIIFCKIKKINFLWFADIATVGLFIAQSIGRWGNFVNGEAYGGLTDLPWGMIVNSHGPVHPTFLYESLWNFIGFIVSYFIVYRLFKTHGASFAYYLIWYGVGRFLIEGLRADSLYIWGTVRVSQMVALISVVLGIGVVLYIFKKKKDDFEVKNQEITE